MPPTTDYLSFFKNAFPIHPFKPNSQQSDVNANDNGIAPSQPKDPAALEDFEQYFEIFRQDWVYEFFFSSDDDLYQQLDCGLKQNNVSVVHYEFNTMEDNHGESFKVNESTNLMVIPIYSTKSISLSLVVDENLSKDGSGSFLTLNHNRHIGKCLRNDAESYFMFISKDIQSGLVEFSYFKLLSPSTRECIFIQCHYDKFEKFLNHFKQTKQFDNQLLYNSLILYLKTFNYRTHCPTCRLPFSDSCPCKIPINLMKHSFDSVTENENLLLYLGSYLGRTALSLYGSAGKLSHTTQMNTRCSTEIRQDPKIKSSLSEWALNFTANKKALTAPPKFQLNYLLSKFSQDSEYNPIQAFTLSALIQNASHNQFLFNNYSSITKTSITKPNCTATSTGSSNSSDSLTDSANIKSNNSINSPNLTADFGNTLLVPFNNSIPLGNQKRQQQSQITFPEGTELLDDIQTNLVQDIGNNDSGLVDGMASTQIENSISNADTQMNENIDVNMADVSSDNVKGTNGNMNNSFVVSGGIPDQNESGDMPWMSMLITDSLIDSSASSHLDSNVNNNDNIDTENDRSVTSNLTDPTRDMTDDVDMPQGQSIVTTKDQQAPIKSSFIPSANALSVPSVDDMKTPISNSSSAILPSSVLMPDMIENFAEITPSTSFPLSDTTAPKNSIPTSNITTLSTSMNETKLRPSALALAPMKIAPAPILNGVANQKQIDQLQVARPTQTSLDSEEKIKKMELRKARNREAAHRSNQKRKLAMLKLREEIEEANSLEMSLREREKVLREENAALRLKAQTKSK